MRMPPEHDGKKPPSTKEEQQEQQQQKEVFPGYHSLCVRSRVSSESSEDDDSERRDDMENGRGRENRNKHRDCEREHSNPIARLRSGRIVAPPPPPPPPPPPSSIPLQSSSMSSSESSRHLSERYVGGSKNSRALQGMPPGSSSSSSSSSSSQQQQQQQNALLTLLNEMRTLELKSQKQMRDYAIERASLVETLSQQAAYISQLELTQQSLIGQNAVLNKRLTTMLTRLDRFATGCWQFSSASVKKMSEALHIQVQEWRKTYRIETNLNASPEEEEAIEATTMEKMQGMHLEIAELKRLNRELRKRMLRRSSELAKNNGSVCGGSLEYDDEVSHMTGITQMTATTSMTTSPTAKLMKAMAGFLTAHVKDGRQEGEEEDASQSCPMDPPDDVVVTVDDTTPKTGSNTLRKKSVQIAPPQSILKSTAKYDRNINVVRAPVSRSHRQQQSTSKQPPNSHQPSLLQPPPPQHAKKITHKRSNPGLPKSPNMRLNGGGSVGSVVVSSSRSSGSGRPSRGNTTVPPPATTTCQTQRDFVDFKGDFGGTGEENDTWLASWGDDASEV